MTAEYSMAGTEVLDLVKDVCEAYHPLLDGARIAVLMCDTQKKSKGRVVYASISVPTAKIKPLLKSQYHWCMIIHETEWMDMDERQKRALVDHELCHAYFDEDGSPKTRGHDLEEFGAVLERHGFWRGDAGEEAIQPGLIKVGVVVGTMGELK